MPPNPIVAIRMRSLGEMLWSAPASPAAVRIAGPVWRKCLLVDIARPFYRRTHGGSGTRIVYGHFRVPAPPRAKSWKLMARMALHFATGGTYLHSATRQRAVPGTAIDSFYPGRFEPESTFLK